VNAVVLAGRNDRKLPVMAALHERGFHVLADKPWVVSADAHRAVRQVTGGGALAMDIMTARHDPYARLRRRLVRTPALFGEFRGGDGPAIDFRSLHHLVKKVNGEWLVRPAWYYDVGAQGDGVVDLHSHLVDQAEWLLEADDLEGGPEYDLDRDVEGIESTRWPTPVPQALFTRSTGEREFPAALASDVRHGVLALRCNGQIRYRLRGVAVRQRAEWRDVEPEGGGDSHHAIIRGTGCDVVTATGPETGFRPRLWVRPQAPRPARRALDELVEAQQAELPGLFVCESTSDAGQFELVIPEALRVPHEAQFARVMDEFLDRLEQPEDNERLRARVRLRYLLLTEAKRRCEDIPPPPED